MSKSLSQWLAYIETQHPSAIAMGLDRVRDVASKGLALRKATGKRVRLPLATLTLVVPDPAAVDVVRAGSAAQLQIAVHDAARDADAVVMAAAVADFRPVDLATDKIKRGDAEPEPLRLAQNHGRAKLARKGCDLLVVNAVGDGKAFEVGDNAGWLLGADGGESEIPTGSKALLASRVWDAVGIRL